MHILFNATLIGLLCSSRIPPRSTCLSIDDEKNSLNILSGSVVRHRTHVGLPNHLKQLTRLWRSSRKEILRSRNSWKSNNELVNHPRNTWNQAASAETSTQHFIIYLFYIRWLNFLLIVIRDRLANIEIFRDPKQRLLLLLVSLNKVKFISVSPSNNVLTKKKNAKKK